MIELLTKRQIELAGFEFEPSITMDSGQTFRWRSIDPNEQTWIGVISGNIIKLTARDATIYSENESRGGDYLESYLSAADDNETIFSQIPQDTVLSQARNNLRGLRLLTQDPWECLISFVCSINCNIPSIHIKIENLCRHFGKRIHSDLDLVAYTFPTPESIAKASKEELLACRLGFRWRYVKFIAGQVASGNLDLANISTQPYAIAHNELMSSTSGKTQGIGPKVADCALLYSYHRTEAFPIDVWILRCLSRYYSNDLQYPNHLSLSSYIRISESMRNKFGRYAGYAQLYLYVAMRTNVITQCTKQA